MRRTAAAALLALLAISGSVAPAGAATTATTLSIRAMTSQVLVGHTFVLFGGVRPVATGVSVTRQVFRDGRWKATGSAVTNAKGDYRMVVTAPATPEHLRLRVTAMVRGHVRTSEVVTVDAVRKLTPTPSPTPTPTPSPTTTATPTPTATPSPSVTASPSATPSPSASDTATVVDTTTVTDTGTVVAPKGIAAYGPGKRIFGLDISRYQHPSATLYPNGAPIDFATMYKAGVRFLFIKASDGRDTGHNNATNWYQSDRTNAQAAGIMTGYYHYAYFPDSTVKSVIIADAQAQADKAVWRLASVGGYNTMDLPYALDVEEWCFATNDNGSCLRRVTKANATLWVKTWLSSVAQRTGRKPFVYSSANFLENFLDRDAKLGELRTYPLWIAHSGPDPKATTDYPGMKTPYGCYITAWTLSTCKPQWSVWQYGVVPASKYGIASGNVDVNVFSGTATELRALTQGVWVPTPGDFLPTNETSTTTVSSLTYSLITKPLTFVADVRRITGGPVVSGTVTLQVLADVNGVAPTPDQITAIRQTVTRSATGTWKVSVTGLPAGTWLAQVAFRDSSGVHAQSTAAVVFTLIDPSPTPVPTITDTATVTDTSVAAAPSPSPSPTPSPTAS